MRQSNFWFYPPNFVYVWTENQIPNDFEYYFKIQLFIILYAYFWVLCT